MRNTQAIKRRKIMLRRTWYFVCGALVLVMALAAPAWAEEKAGGLNPEEIKKALGLSIYLQAGYTYNFTDPDSGENELRVFDHKANSFTLDLAQIVFAKDAPSGGVGFKLKLSAGEVAKFIHSRGLGSADDAFDLTEAYVSYLAPLGRGLKIDFGKYVTYHGAEVIEAKDNPNYSRSLLFNYAIPFTHTGLKVSYPFSDALVVTAHVVNGWDNTDDNNSAKSWMLNIGYTPGDRFSTVFNLMYGPEKDDNNSDNRFLIDWVGTVKPVKDLTVVLNVDYATEEHSAADGGGAKWYGVAGTARYDINDRYSIAVRAEYFKDPDGIRTGTAQSLKELTITPEIRVAPGLIVRPEYRHDWSDEPVFEAGGRKSQDTFALAVLYAW